MLTEKLERPTKNYGFIMEEQIVKKMRYYYSVSAKSRKEAVDKMIDIYKKNEPDYQHIQDEEVMDNRPLTLLESKGEKTKELIFRDTQVVILNNEIKEDNNELVHSRHTPET